MENFNLLFLLAWAVVAALFGIVAFYLDHQDLAVGWFLVATVALGFHEVARAIHHDPTE